jgi:hypothetical protein
VRGAFASAARKLTARMAADAAERSATTSSAKDVAERSSRSSSSALGLVVDVEAAVGRTPMAAAAAAMAARLAGENWLAAQSPQRRSIASPPPLVPSTSCSASDSDAEVGSDNDLDSFDGF